MGIEFDGRRHRISAVLPFALALAPLAYLIWLCVSLHVDIPFGDQWELVPRLNHLDAGTFTFHDVWQQHNEHRPIIPILIMLGLAWVTDWNVSVEIGLNVVLGVAIFLVYVAALRDMARDRRRVPSAVEGWRALPLISLLVFSPSQWENWLWGWQMQIFMCVLGSLYGFWLLATPGRSPWRLAGAIGAGLFSMYSVGAGLSFWPMGLIAIALNPDQRTARRFVVWTIASAVIIGTYFIDYHQVAGHPSMMSNFQSLEAVANLAVYTFKYLGAPLASQRGHVAAVAGAAGLVMFASLVAACWSRRHTSACLFPLLAGLNAIADAGMTALGRAGFGTDQAMASRYQTIGAPFWVAILLLTVLALHLRRAAQPHQPAWTIGAVAASFTMAAAIVASGAQGEHAANQRMDFLRAARPSLVAGINWRMLSRLYIDDVPSIRERAGILKMLGMSVYREGQ